MIEIAGGKAVSFTEVRKGKPAALQIRFRPGEVSDVLGGEWTEKEIRASLGRLGFGVKTAARGEWKVTAPSYRGDIARPVDLIEEVARLQGLDRVPEKFPPLASPAASGTDLSRERKVRVFLADAGFQETIHYSFVSPEIASALGSEGSGAALANPLSRDESILRPSLVPSLLSAASLHARHKMETFRAFELRKVFRTGNGDRIDERKKLAGLITGSRLLSHWSGGVHGADFYDLKGAVEGVLDVLGLASRSVFLKSAVPYLHPGQQAEVKVDGESAGCLGEAHPDLLARFGLKKAAYVFELDWDRIASKASQGVRFRDYPSTPVVERDLAVVVEEGVAAGDLLDAIRKTDPVIAGARVFDLYRGGQISPGKKSLAFSIRMGRADRTLTDEEINAVFQKVIEGVSKFGAEVRSFNL